MSVWRFMRTGQTLSTSSAATLRYFPCRRIHRRRPLSSADPFWDALRSWFCPPFHRAEQGAPVNLTTQQRRYATLRRPGEHPWRRVKGPAESGKSLVLAHKAAEYASTGRTALIVCFNRTLTSYLRDLLERMPFDFDRRDVTIVHFHELLRRIRVECEEPAPWPHESGLSTEDQEDREVFLDSAYPHAVAGWLRERPLSLFRYDAVLIDEGQDFLRPWVEVMGLCVSASGELLVVADERQNVYERDLGWGEPGFKGFSGLPGFRGPWGHLETSHRLSEPIAAFLSEFSRTHFKQPGFESSPSRESLLFGKPFLRWENLPDRVLERAAEVADELTKGTEGANHPSNLVVVTQTNQDARDATRLLRGRGLSPLHISADGDARTPYRFRAGDTHIKVVTGHSFKGFEVFGVIVCVTRRWPEAKQARWIYTAARGAMEGLWVVNSDYRFAGAVRLMQASR